MKRGLLMVLLLLVGGAIVNVAVAWACSWWARPHVVDVRGTSRSDAEQFRQQFPGLTLHCEVTVLASGFGFKEQSTIRWLKGYSGVSQVWYREHFLEASERQRQGAMAIASDMFQTDDVKSTPSMTVEAGWPRLSLFGLGDPLFSAFVSPRRVETVRAIAFERSGSITRLLPYEPIWPGFAINTVFYAGVLWLLFAAPFALRRWRRIKRGLCPKCAYDLRGTPKDATACPECGAAVSLSLP